MTLSSKFQVLEMITFSKLSLPKIFNSVKTYQLKRTKKTNVPKKRVEPWSPVIGRLDEDDCDECLDLMWTSYYKDEPISKSLGITRNKILDEYVCNTLIQGHSFVAKRNTDGKIMAACINDIANPGTADEMYELACTTSNKKVKELLKFWAVITRGPDLQGTTQVFEMAHLFVAPEGRRRGLAMELATRSFESGADCGFPLIRIDASAHQTARIAEKLGMELIYEILFCNYIGRNGRPVVASTPNDKSVKIYVARPLKPQTKE